MSLTPKENLLRVIHHDHPEWVPHGPESQVATEPPVTERPGAAEPDSWGVQWSYEEGAQGGTYPTHGGHTITDIRRWREQVTIPDVDALDWDHLQVHLGEGESCRPDEVDRDKYLLTGFVGFGVFERTYLLLGMNDALMAYVTETELMGELVAAIADYKIRLIERLDDLAHLEMVWYGDDWGTQRKLFLPPDIWRETVGRHTRRVYECMKGRGLLVDQHSDGNIESIFGDLVEMGADVWSPCQPCNDLAGLKKQYAGRIAFSGGIDSQFVLDRPGVTPEEVRAEVRRRIDELASGGGYIAGPSHGVAYRPEIIEAMNDEIATYGRQFYQAE